MSEPEIARRCTSCGVSVRQHAMFCPQCGNPIGNPNLSETQPLSAVAPETLPDIAQTQALDAVHHPPVKRIPDDSVRGRVEKFRKVSSVVIDQAAYDPSLRFLLVAAGLFVLFIILVILSKVLG